MSTKNHGTENAKKTAEAIAPEVDRSTSHNIYNALGFNGLQKTGTEKIAGGGGDGIYDTETNPARPEQRELFTPAECYGRDVSAFMHGL